MGGFGWGLHQCIGLCTSFALSNWGLLICSLALHKVPKGLERRWLDASDFSLWDLIYLNRVGNMGFEKWMRKGCQLMWLFRPRVSSEFVYLRSLILNELVPSPYRNNCRVQNTGRKFSLLARLFPFIIIISLSQVLHLVSRISPPLGVSSPVCRLCLLSA